MPLSLSVSLLLNFYIIFSLLLSPLSATCRLFNESDTSLRISLKFNYIVFFVLTDVFPPPLPTSLRNGD